MLFLQIQIDENYYILDISKVIEIIPIVSITNSDYNNDFVVGDINYRGMVVPVIDLTKMIANRETRQFLSSRIIIIEFANQKGIKNQIGILAENITDIVSFDQEDFQDKNIELSKFNFLKGKFFIGKSKIQELNLDSFLSNVLFNNLLAANK